MRIIAFIVLMLISLFAPLWLCALCAFVYVFRYPGYEILFLGVCIDAQFGINAGGPAYSYTLIFSATLLATEMVRPYINVRFGDI